MERALVLETFEALKGIAKAAHHAELVFDPDTDVSESDLDAGNARISIGAARFARFLAGGSDGLDDLLFANAVRAFFHEKRHLAQMAAIASDDPGDIPEGVLSAVRAGTHDPSEGEIYYNDPAELDAEAASFREAGPFLASRFPDRPTARWLFDAACLDPVFLDPLYDEIHAPEGLDVLDAMACELEYRRDEAVRNMRSAGLIP